MPLMEPLVSSRQLVQGIVLANLKVSALGIYSSSGHL